MKIAILSEAARQRVLSVFITLNLLVIGWSNLPEEPVAAGWRKVEAVASPRVEWMGRWAAWQLSRYGYHTGLDSRWQMFGFQSRFNWWYTVRGRYSDGARTMEVLLPLPHQSSPTLWEYLIRDAKDQKLRLNLYNRPLAREAYSRYLARQSPTHEGLPIRAVCWTLNYQMILPPDEAQARGQLVDPRVGSQVLNEFEIPAFSLVADTRRP